MINEINILMVCSWKFGEKLGDGPEREVIEDTHEIHSAYLNHVDALSAAKFYKEDDESSGLYANKYWVIIVPVTDQAPSYEEISS